MINVPCKPVVTDQQTVVNEHCSSQTYNLISLSFFVVIKSEEMNFTSNFLVLLLVAWQSLVVVGEVYFKKGAPHVQLSNGGLLSGIVKFSRDGRPFHSFTGIPYATIPERFQESQLITNPSWPGVMSATKKGAVCPQMAMSSTTEDLLGEEECLNLNVYVPMNSSASGKRGFPVMLWIHGGIFGYGDGFGYGPKVLLDEDVILITINYRLGAFGFLSTGDNVIPGNNGLKDIVVALQWVQENIQKFGGNPNSVTIFGESAGGAAVHYLMLSPVTKGLFHRAISQSGTALNPWAYDPNPKHTAVELATFLKCATIASEPALITSEEILECLKGLSTEELTKAQYKFRKGWPTTMPYFYFVPSTEPSDPISSLTPLLSEPPISALTRKDIPLAEIPWMVGATEDEGTCLYSCVVFDKPELLNELNTNWEHVAPLTFDYGRYLVEEGQTKIFSQKLKQFYFADKEIGVESTQALTNLYSDAMFLYGTYKSAFETASRGKRNPVYLYQYVYNGPISFLATALNIKGEYTKSAGHGDDLQHIFDFDQWFPGAEELIKPDSPDEEFSKNLVRLWTSFAIHGEPKHTWGNATFRKWKAISKKEMHGVYPLRWFRIGTNPVSYDIDQAVKDRMQLWDSLWSDHLTSAIMTSYKPSTIEETQKTATPDKTEL